MTTIAWISIAIALVCALVIVADELKHPQKMAIMNVVWPVTALYFSVVAVWAYFTIGRKKTGEAMQAHQQHSGDQPSGSIDQKKGPPSPAQVAVGTSHCGAGCMIADVLVEFALETSGLVLLGSVLGTRYIVDFIAAWALGILFQYFAIKPMRPQLSTAGGVLVAIKADTLSILAFQIGMYAWMALVYFKLYPAPHLKAFDIRYWLMMQIGMICGFATSYPMNRLLIRSGLKEAM